MSGRARLTFVSIWRTPSAPDGAMTVAIKIKSQNEAAVHDSFGACYQSAVFA
jgi:hypothetical protein